MNKPFLLVVEDDSAIRNLIAATLETQGYHFHVSTTGLNPFPWKNCWLAYG